MRALMLYGETKHYQSLACANMRTDLSWERSAKLYYEIYEQIKGMTMADIERNDELLRREPERGQFSSHVHGIESLSTELGEFGKIAEFQIPDRYNMNTLVLLPINVQTSFIYWEITDEHIRNLYTGPYEYFVIKAVEKQDEHERDLYQLQSPRQPRALLL